MELLGPFLEPRDRGRPFVALVSPSIRELLPDTWERLTGLLLAEGARAVYPVDEGIPEFLRRSARDAIHRGPGLHILSACPAAILHLEQRGSFAERVLESPSPMLLLAESALAAAFPGQEREGFALAITPCSYKRLELPRAAFDFRVLELDRLLDALETRGLGLEDYPARTYALEPPKAVHHCGIAAAVAAELRAAGCSARAITLEGTAAAEEFFSDCPVDGSWPADPGQRIIVELSFCEGGCAQAARCAALQHQGLSTASTD